MKKSVYAYDGTASTGLDLVPQDNLILIEDSDGSGTPKLILLTDTSGITDVMTVATLLALTAKWEEVSSSGSGLPDATNKKGHSITTGAVSASDAEWSPVSTNPNLLEADYVIDTGVSAVVASGFTIDDGVTLTIPTGSVLSVV